MKARVHLLPREQGETEFEFVTRTLRRVGLKDLVGPDEQRVLINPNWVVAEHSSLGNVTSTEVLRALVHYLIEEAGVAPGKIVVADGGEPETSRRVVGINRVERLHRDYGVKVLNLLDDEPVRDIPVPNPLSLQSVALARTAWEASCIIAVPCLKTHSMAVTTLSCKNTMGCLTPPRSFMHHEIHRRVPDLVSVLRHKIRFQLIDGIMASEGDECAGRPVRMDLLIAGTDPVAVDTVGSAVIGYGPDEAEYLRYAAQKGLGVSDLGDIEVVGATISAVSRRLRPARDFDPPAYSERLAPVAGLLLGKHRGPRLLSRLAVTVRLHGASHVARRMWLLLRRRAVLSLYRALARRQWYWGELASWRASGADAGAYREWLVCRRARRCELASMRLAQEELRYRPLLTFISRFADGDLEGLVETADSLLRQAYPRWEWVVVGTGKDAVEQALRGRLGGEARIRIVPPREDGDDTPSSAENAGLAVTAGDYVAFLEPGDQLAPEALFEIACRINEKPEADLVYTDEDRIFPDGSYGDPFFKPDWCPEGFLSRPYMGGLSLFRTDMVRNLGGVRAGGAEARSIDLVLRLTDEGGVVEHVPNVLFHRRRERPVQPSPGVADALREAVDRGREPAVLEPATAAQGIWFVRHRIEKPGPVSVITWTRDEGDYLEACAEAVFERTTYRDFEWILTDNGSHSPKTADVIRRWSEREPLRFRPNRLETDEFNFASLCNHGAARARGEYLLFLSNDTSVITPGWIEALLEQAQRPSIGAVGAMLLYGDDTIQHAGAVMGLGGLAAHGHRGFHRDSPGYFGQIQSVNNYLSVAATCMMVRASVFREAGGFDEGLPFDYSDVDFCLKVHELGYRNVYLPYVRVYHYEDKEHGSRQVERDPALFERSATRIRERWSTFIQHDPCYNPHLTRESEDYAIGRPVPR
jgi:uncharacterized protein (DUF362 family)